jgi:hypothetical protein
MAVVDWRDRFNANWISSVRSQGSAPNCWAFAMTALYESMVRIEHGVWCRRSEGDLGRATGKQSWDLGNLGEASIAAERFGVADPDCMAWSEAAVLYTAKPHGAAMTAMPLSPTPDRAGRTVRIGANTHATIGAGSIQDKKDWLTLHGPMAFMCTLPAGFSAAPAAGVYTRPLPAVDDGVHAMLVVGFDDTQGCWIVKNSWGTWFADNGFVRVAYGQAWLEDAAWTGVRNTNPDPWTKRRLHNGVVFESGNGAAHQNRELFLRRGTDIVHEWQEAGGGPWNVAGIVRSPDDWRPIPSDAIDCPAAVQSTFNRNFELVYRSNTAPSSSGLRHLYFDQASGWWFDAALFGPPNPVGIPGFVQGNRGAPGDYEVAVMTQSGAVEHWTKHNGSPWTHPPGTWYRRAVIATSMRAGGPGLVSSRRNLVSELEQETGELHYVCASSLDLRHFRRNPATGAWAQAAAFGAGTYSGPCMIESPDEHGDELSAGALEVFAESGAAIEHWTLAAPTPALPSPAWTHVTTFGADVRRVIGALLGSNAALEVYVERTDGRYQEYVRTGVTWAAGPILP